ncbi:hypothetical protein LY11_04465 [Pedobacter cryoconitis]|uniref:Uncharacterized protein n=1 Tax=Pedobacter cryoconitis TaxID=188932 RepID=A0A327S7H4_9SPHI|nr:hypothetical protein LY11_04465 [Pedobacter cryoconitis]
MLEHQIITRETDSENDFFVLKLTGNDIFIGVEVSNSRNDIRLERSQLEEINNFITKHLETWPEK